MSLSGNGNHRIGNVKGFDEPVWVFTVAVGEGAFPNPSPQRLQVRCPWVDGLSYSLLCSPG
ncbi:MAG: hypothetical protein ACI9W2_004516 [Gammaproteobacteria bacterium]|jgi:hypothetical protein